MKHKRGKSVRLDIDRIKSELSNAVRRGCSDRGCRLRLDGLGDHVVLKGEDLYQDRMARKPPMCDCIIFVVNASIIVGIVELKSKTVDANQIERKLTNSSRAALDILSKYADRHAKTEFYYVVLCKRWRTIENRAVKNRKIRATSESRRRRDKILR